MREVKITLALARLLREFLADPSKARYGYDLMQATGYPSGKLYPLLGKLAHAGWVTRERESINPAAEGRPVRLLYRLTDSGTAAARYELAALSQQLSPPPQIRPRLRPEGGHA